MRVFAFLDLTHPAVAWAVMRGVLVSSDCVPGIAQHCPSFMLAGIIKGDNAARLFNESIIEQIRVARFLDRVSRLRGMYFFRSRDEAEARINDPFWPPHFILANLVEFELKPSGVPAIIDANWITFAPLDNRGQLDTSKLSWIDAYWTARPYPGKDPVWEVIANGVAIVLDPGVRRQCYEAVRATFPESWPFIEMARIGAEVGSHGGLIMPYFESEDGQIVKLCYLMRDAEFNENAVIDKIREHPYADYIGQLMGDGATLKTPDLSHLSHTFLVKPAQKPTPETPLRRPSS